MREYYGNLRECAEYISDENHKAIVWKEHPFSFKLENHTKYTLLVRGKRMMYDFVALKASESMDVVCNNWWTGELEVVREDKQDIKCNFLVERGCMIERSVCEDIKEEYIAPVFRDGKVKIVTCTDCGPNLGVIPEYNIEPLKYPMWGDEIKVTNYTLYDIIISYENKVIGRIPQKSGIRLKIPYYGILYFDTEAEEIFYQDRFDEKDKKILRVNGCCARIEYGIYKYDYSIAGPEDSEPYVRYLYTSRKNNNDNYKDIDIWCCTIDYRLD